MEEIEVNRFLIEYTSGKIKYYTGFAKGSIELRQDGLLITTFERDIEYSDEYDYGYGYNYDLPKKEIFEYKINQWEIQRVFFNRYDLLSLTSAKEDIVNPNEGQWKITIETEKDCFSFKGTKYPEPYGEELFDALKRLIKYKVIQDLP